PFERQDDIRPDQFQKGQISGATVIRARQDEVKRRGVDAAVITLEWHFTEGGHFAVTRLVQDLARLGILLGRDFRSLCFAEEGEDAARDRRSSPEAFERGNDSITPKGRDEPGNAPIGIKAYIRRREQHAEIDARALQPKIEALIRRRDLT